MLIFCVSGQKKVSDPFKGHLRSFERFLEATRGRLRPSKASYGQSHMFLAQKLHFVILISNLLQKNFLRLIWRPFEAILLSKSPFEGVQRGSKGPKVLIFCVSG